MAKYGQKLDSIELLDGICQQVNNKARDTEVHRAEYEVNCHRTDS